MTRLKRPCSIVETLSLDVCVIESDVSRSDAIGDSALALGADGHVSGSAAIGGSALALGADGHGLQSC